MHADVSIERNINAKNATPSVAPLFRSFFMGGFECSTHRNRSGRRLDLIAATRHDMFARADYERLRSLGILTARDGLRWHLIERRPYRYDFSSLLPLVEAARATGVQVLWDLFHYGWPDDLEIFSPQFIDRFSGLARAVTRLLREEGNEAPFISPINEISYFAWAAGEEACFFPYACGRSDELKRQLVRAAIAGIEAIRDVSPQARIIHTDPLINVIARRKTPQDLKAAERYNLSQYEALDLLSGKIEPELGGHGHYLDILGINYYLHNQWYYPDREMVPFSSSEYRPLKELLREFDDRYHRPAFIAETGIEDEYRPSWLQYVGDEVRAALLDGLPLEGICLYPILNHPGWEDDRHCHNGLWDYADEAGERIIYEPMKEEINRQYDQFERCRSQVAPTNLETGD